MSATAAEVAARVVEARATGTALRVTGAGSWLDAGWPVEAATPLPLAGLHGITEYEPGDLTLTARAATPLAEIARVTAVEGQWLPLDPFGPSLGTLGATVATASAGPLATAYGTPRDQVLGCEVVTGRGEIVRAGGRVVKNVAGFDLTRLMTGAWGTLGAITEVTVRLRARPERDETVAIALADAARVETALVWLRATEYAPLAAELLSPTLSHELGASADAGGGATLLLRFGGNGRLVRAALDAAASLGLAAPVPADVWSRLARAEPAGAAVLRLSTAPSRLAALWRATADVVHRAGGLAHATPGRGVVRCILPLAADAESLPRLRGIVDALPAATRIVERLPAALLTAAPPDPVRDQLARGIRAAFDPDRLLNPGILDPLA